MHNVNASTDRPRRGLAPALENKATPEMRDGALSLDVLLAEDNIINQRLVVRMLQRDYHGVTVVQNGLAAVAAVREKTFDVILMNIHMPVMGGFDATALIREHEGSLGVRRTPIIALTADTNIGDREKCIQAQMDGYLPKPLRLEELMEAMRRIGTCA